ncbi:hypothetical protein K227x_32180 [Rubripirellula lacrimiformis]|uniref:Uncharacterized protein n=1 Tax=Rubripirellula lacrimiformis TaxID=1930273 RepID=A0A517NCI9_9BACT|nr:hypothetical protein K227x_32180 [Rubripirellula lacrimiformis]
MIRRSRKLLAICRSFNGNGEPLAVRPRALGGFPAAHAITAHSIDKALVSIDTGWTLAETLGESRYWLSVGRNSWRVSVLVGRGPKLLASLATGWAWAETLGEFRYRLGVGRNSWRVSLLAGDIGRFGSIFGSANFLVAWIRRGARRGPFVFAGLLSNLVTTAGSLPTGPPHRGPVCRCASRDSLRRPSIVPSSD